VKDILEIGDTVRHRSDPHGRPAGKVVQPADQHGLVIVEWGPGRRESVHESEVRRTAMTGKRFARELGVDVQAIEKLEAGEGPA
jgi:DhnA family fructose-bisphosphate aldolase class Ia